VRAIDEAILCVHNLSKNGKPCNTVGTIRLKHREPARVTSRFKCIPLFFARHVNDAVLCVQHALLSRPMDNSPLDHTISMLFEIASISKAAFDYCCAVINDE
jgi:hypothetical protein